MALSGRPDGPPRLGAAAVAARADLLARNLRLRAGGDVFATLEGAALLGERAALLGLARRGRVSPGGSCRLLRAGDGWLALNLARPDDRALLPAWLEDEPDRRETAWAFVARAIRTRSAAGLVARGRLLGMAVASAGNPAPVAAPIARRPFGVARARPLRGALVVDLSSLWAGPLCTQLLAQAGARVVKVESTRRPDGARRGAAFFDRLHAGKASVALDFGDPRGRDALRRLVTAADAVVEASRPRALRQLGIVAEEVLAERPGQVWISLTGYGREEPEAGWIAFGDDAAVAGGLADRAGDEAGPLFCADAVADPLAGLEAADETLAALERGGGCRIDVTLRGAAQRAATADDDAAAAVVRRNGEWFVAAEGVLGRVAPPRARRAAGRARPLGADTHAVLREVGASC